MKTSKLLTLSLCVVSSLFASAQTENGPVAKKLYFSPLPVIGANPAFGFFYGAAASGSMYLGDPSTTSISNGLLTATYSTKKQLMFTLKSNIYTADNGWFLIGDYRLFFSSQPTYGLGTGGQNLDLSQSQFPNAILNDNELAEPLNFNLIRFYETFTKSVYPDLYVGVGLHIDIFSEIEDQGLDLTATTPVLTNHYLYSTHYGFDPSEYSIIGASANVIYDTRDNISYPYEGEFAYVSWKYNPEFLGSDQSSSTLWLEYRKYLSMSSSNPRNILAFWGYANLTTSGRLPYMALPSVGWDQMGRSGRAYPQGRFRGDNMVYLEAEYRFPLPILKSKPNLIGGTVFANMTTASSEDNNVQLFDYLQPAGGVGLRIMLSEAARTNLTIDYGWGANGASAFYLNLNEYF